MLLQYVVIPLAFWIIERKSKRLNCVKDPSDYWDHKFITMLWHFVLYI